MVKTTSQEDSGDSGDYIYTTKITLKNGKILYAWEVGLRAFRIPKRNPKRIEGSSRNDDLGNKS